MKHFTGSFLFAALCLGLGAAYGWFTGGTVAAALSALWICIVLSILEVSLSFDNAVVNATVLRSMSPKWQGMFLTVGVLIAVFGMRLVFPIAIVAVAGHMNPVDALNLSLTRPADYVRIITGAHTGIMGFGGAFLMLVGLKFFFDADKEHDWIAVIEGPLKRFADLEAFEIMFTLAMVYGVSLFLPAAESHVFLVAGVLGTLTFFAVEWLGNLLQVPEEAVDGVRRAGLGAFLYLEVLDASFSFDGVIGSFALSNDLVIIALGLGIGAMFVRSLTVALVRTGTLSQFRYLEHGAFWAILALAAIMLVSVRVEVPQAVTGLVGALLIGLSLWSSILHNRLNPPAAVGVS